MLSSQYLSILLAYQNCVEALDLQFNNAPVPIQVKKMTRWLQNISLPSLPIVLIAPDEKGESVEPFTTEDEVLVKYRLIVALIAAGNQDLTAFLDMWLNWREQMRQQAQFGLSDTGAVVLPSVFFGEFDADPPILRDAILKNYDISGFSLCLWNVEKRRVPNLPI